MNLRDDLKRIRWWYRTTFKRWHEGPEYADCPNCDGQVYHRLWGVNRSIVKYHCRDCTWNQYGMPDFAFYHEQKPEPTWDVYQTYFEVVRKHAPDDLDELETWLNDGGEDIVIDRLDEELDQNQLEALAEELGWTAGA